MGGKGGNWGEHHQPPGSNPSGLCMPVGHTLLTAPTRWGFRVPPRAPGTQLRILSLVLEEELNKDP